MPSFVKPEWKTLSGDAGVADSLQNYIVYNDETITYEGETITKADYIKNVLFSGKYNDKITLEYCGKCSGDTEGSQGLFAMYLDKSNNDRAALYACKHTGYTNRVTGSILFNSVYKISDYLYTVTGINNFWTQFAAYGNSSSNFTIKVMSYNTFCIIDLYNSNYVSVYNSISHDVLMLYDFTNHECVMFDSGLRYISLSKPNQFSYTRPLTYDGYYLNSGNQIHCLPFIRESSNNEVTYCKLKMLDGLEATRVYMLTKLPVNAGNSILTVGNKKLYVMTNVSNDGCALAIDCSADMAS